MERLNIETARNVSTMVDKDANAYKIIVEAVRRMSTKVDMIIKYNFAMLKL